MLPALILAAGASRRMGRPKAVLPAPDGSTFIVRLVRAFAAAGVTDVIVVTGSHHDEIAHALSVVELPVTPRVVRNPDPDRGQLSSLWVGMDVATGGNPQGLLVTLVDVPLVAPGTIRQVIDVWQRTSAPIVRPAIGDEHGHPVLFDRRLFDELRRAPLEAGAKVVVRAHEAEIVNVSVDDRGCLVDVDTPEDYAALRTLDS